MTTTTNHWAKMPDDEHPVTANFAGGETQWTTLEHAADLADFIDRDQGIADLLAGVTIRTKLGTMLTINEGAER